MSREHRSHQHQHHHNDIRFWDSSIPWCMTEYEFDPHGNIHWICRRTTRRHDSSGTTTRTWTDSFEANSHQAKIYHQYRKFWDHGDHQGYYMKEKEKRFKVPFHGGSITYYPSEEDDYEDDYDHHEQDDNHDDRESYTRRSIDHEREYEHDHEHSYERSSEHEYEEDHEHNHGYHHRRDRGRDYERDRSRDRKREQSSKRVRFA